MVGKWHIGVRYRRADSSPAVGWDDADLTQPLFDTPLDHGFDVCRITSRSHGTSGPQPNTNRNRPDQTVGPGHIDGRIAVGATGNGRELVNDGPDAYVLSELGGRHSESAINFLDDHLSSVLTASQPFFLYYACNSNHRPYTPDTQVGDLPVAGAARNKAGEGMGARSDFIYENDCALARLLDYLTEHDDPRNPGTPLIQNTVVVFTSDNGADRDANTATGPFRSNKGSVYEGGHRVPFIVAWPAGGVGNGDADTPGRTSDVLIGLQDMFATFAELLETDLPDLRAGAKGAEDSVSVLPAWRGETLLSRPMFFNDHKQTDDHAAAAIRMDVPESVDDTFAGQWKLFLDAALLRAGTANPIELYDLASDPQEQRNRLNEEELQSLVEYLTETALRHRNAGGHRTAKLAAGPRMVFDWRNDESGKPDEETIRLGLNSRSDGERAADFSIALAGARGPNITLTVGGVTGDEPLTDERFSTSQEGLGLSGGRSEQVDAGEALLIHFNHDVIVESAAIVAGDGSCGGFYRVGDASPLAIYCVDADIDAQDQSGILSDLGVLRAGQVLRLDSSPHFGVETPGQWRLAALTIRVLSE
jgi:arylsulfatase A